MEEFSSLFGHLAVSISKWHENLENKVLRKEFLKEGNIFFSVFSFYYYCISQPKTVRKNLLYGKILYWTRTPYLLLVLFSFLSYYNDYYSMCAFKFFRWLSWISVLFHSSCVVELFKTYSSTWSALEAVEYFCSLIIPSELKTVKYVLYAIKTTLPRINENLFLGQTGHLYRLLVSDCNALPNRVHQSSWLPSVLYLSWEHSVQYSSDWQ